MCNTLNTDVHLNYEILRTLRNSLNEEPGGLNNCQVWIGILRLGNTYWSVYRVLCSEKQALFSLKLFHFCLCGCWHFWFQSGTFGDDVQVPLSRFSIVSSRSAFIFLAIVCFPESLHTQGLHKFVGSISGVVSMNTPCILKMILE